MQDGREGDVLEGADGDAALEELDGDAGGAEPGSDGAAIRGEEHAQHDEGAASGTTRVEPVSEVAEDNGHRGGEMR